MEPGTAGIGALGEALRACEAVLVGAGAGLSASAGFTYSGERFERYFGDFREKYGFSDMYTGGFYPYRTLGEFWGFWSRYVFVNRYMDAPRPVHRDLLSLLSGKDFFVLTTNVDHCFQKAGFPKERLFYTQGDYGLFQCSVPCHGRTYDNEGQIRAMLAKTRFPTSDAGLPRTPEGRTDFSQIGTSVPDDLVPRCPVCGKPLSMNLRADATFVQDEGWERAAARYGDFLGAHQGSRILLLELGVGMNTPGIIKYPFWRLAAENPRATYACINRGEAACPREIAARSVCLDADIGAVLGALRA